MNPVYLEFFQAFSLLLTKSEGLSLPDSRALSTEFFTKGVVKEAVYKIDDRTVFGLDNNDIPIRVYRPSDKSSLPTLLFFHSGGWAFGSIDDADALCRQIANRAACIVISIDYRLAPENHFPKGLEDCYEVTKWTFQNAEKIGCDATRIGVSGESCGANLAAALTLMAREKGEFNLKYQLLIYPVMTNELLRYCYSSSLDQTYITYDVMKLFWNMYVLDPKEGDHPFASPLKAQSLANLPPAFVVTAENDPLHVEGEAYLSRLKDAGVVARGKRYPGAIHSFLSLPINVLPEREEALRDICEELRKNL